MASNGDEIQLETNKSIITKLIRDAGEKKTTKIDSKTLEFFMDDSGDVPNLEIFLKFLNQVFKVIHDTEVVSKDSVNEFIVNKAKNMFKKHYADYPIPETLPHPQSKSLMVPFCFIGITRSPYFPGEIIEECVNTLNIDVTPLDRQGNTLLMWFIANSKNEAAKAILDSTKGKPSVKDMIDKCIAGTDDVDSFGTAAIHLIVAKGYRDQNSEGGPLSVSNLELLANLIDSGANINATTETNYFAYDDYCYGNTALHFACARRDMDFIKFLLENGADQNLKNSKGQSPKDLLSISKEEAYKIVNDAVSPNNFDKVYTTDEFELNQMDVLFLDSSSQSHNSVVNKNFKEQLNQIKLESSPPKDQFIQKHKELLHNEKSVNIIGRFRRTNINYDDSLADIVKHAQINNTFVPNRSRQAFMELGWMNRDGSFTDTTPDEMHSTSQFFHSTSRFS